MVIRHNPQVNLTEVFSAPSKSRELISNSPEMTASCLGACHPNRSYLRVPSRCTLDLRTQYEMDWRDSGTHSADETGTPSRCTCISHRQPSGHSRSFLQDCTVVRFDMGITGFAPGHSQVADPFCHCMHV
jgi:hypothetical protein